MIIFSNSNSERLKIDASGNLYIGTSSSLFEYDFVYEYCGTLIKIIPMSNLELYDILRTQYNLTLIENHYYCNEETLTMLLLQFKGLESIT